MHHLMRYCFLGVALLIVGCQQAVQLSEQDIAAIRKTSARYVETSVAGDHNAWSLTLAEDVVFMRPNRPAIEGREAKRDFAAANYLPSSELTLNILEIEGFGNLAFVRGRYTGMLYPPDAEPFKRQGKYIEIWKKQADGSWKIYRDIWNSDRPLAE